VGGEVRMKTIVNSQGKKKQITPQEEILIKKQGLSVDQYFELYPNEDNTNFAGMNIVDYDSFIDSDFQGIEEQPPPRVPRGVGGSQGKGYPTEEAMQAMEKERQFQVQQEIEKLQRNEDKLALEQYMILKDAELYGAMAQDLFTLGLASEAVGFILAPALKTQQVAAETIIDTFGTATKTVKDVTKPRIYTPRTKEEVVQNLEKFAAEQAKKPGFEPLAQYTKRARRSTFLAPDDVFEIYGKVPPPSATRKYAAAQDLLQTYNPDNLKYDEISSYHRRLLPRRAFDDMSYQTKDIEVPVRGEITMERMVDAPKTIGKEAAALFVPFIGNYSSVQEAEGSRQEAIKRQQELYNNASPAVKEAIDKLQ
jgi:hypothetical protein